MAATFTDRELMVIAAGREIAVFVGMRLPLGHRARVRSRRRVDPLTP